MPNGTGARETELPERGWTVHDQAAYGRFSLMLGGEMDSDDLVHLLTEVIIGVDPAKSCCHHHQDR